MAANKTYMATASIECGKDGTVLVPGSALDLANLNGIVTLDGSGDGNTGAVFTANDTILVIGVDTWVQIGEAANPTTAARWPAGLAVEVQIAGDTLHFDGVAAGTVSWFRKRVA